MVAYGVILLFIIVGYFLVNMLMHCLPEVEAGPIAGVTTTGSRRVTNNVSSSYRVNENGINRLHRNFVVKGNCMSQRGINEGDVVDVKMFTSDERRNSASLISANDIVLIYLNDKRFRGYKLRIVKSLNADEAITYYYEQGVERNSSQAHCLNDIVGVVYSHRKIF